MSICWFSSMRRSTQVNGWVFSGGVMVTNAVTTTAFCPLQSKTIDSLI
jgi:hypothetical protein